MQYLPVNRADACLFHSWVLWHPLISQCTRLYGVPRTHDVGLPTQYRFNAWPASQPIACSMPVNLLQDAGLTLSGVSTTGRSRRTPPPPVQLLKQMHICLYIVITMIDYKIKCTSSTRRSLRTLSQGDHWLSPIIRYTLPCWGWKQIYSCNRKAGRTPPDITATHAVF